MSKGDLEKRIRRAARERIPLQDVLPEPIEVPPEAWKDRQVRRLVGAFWQLEPARRASVELMVLDLFERQLSEQVKQ